MKADLRRSVLFRLTFAGVQLTPLTRTITFAASGVVLVISWHH